MVWTALAFTALLTAGIFYVDYTTNALLGTPEIKIVHAFSKNIANAVDKIRFQW